jgi:CRP-like cAMP-binding protein
MTWSLSLCVRDHLLAVLRDLAGRWGSPVEEGTVIGLPVSQGALAAMVGASRESVNRALRQLLASGAVRRRGRRYVLVAASPAPGGEERP